ncbi:uncharacterized protein LOC6642836 isoform X2 [Drosophila willistoni]|uniref:uncharacterized protein LOC6642836 isoform X2 n=1 Tax=Drosophila willistoni TaxID=7260 RepID=UPI000C26C4D7|nr:uncharacterized protein LOC6642836 isoform X2 [Drosophila willistoni]
MGAKASKLEGGSYLPDTPTLNKLRLPKQLQPQEQVELTPTRQDATCLDPRSPNGCRTPLNNPKEKHVLMQQVKNEPEQGQDEESNENAFAQFKKRLLKGFSLNDPRSPQLNRTPLILDEVRSLNLDDTFADLFVDTRAGAATVKITSETATTTTTTTPTSSPPTSSGDDDFGTPLSHNNSSLEIISLPYDAEETMPCDVKLQKTPAIHIHDDPRSPSLNVERTPIIFCGDEDDEAHEAQMLEQILETLTLNLSQESSIMEMPPQQLPANKHLERVRLGNKRRVAPRKPARATKTQIYVDKESATPSKPNSGANTGPSTPLSGQKRTPLSCVKNRQHLAPSQTVEKDMRKIPFNDQLNPSRILIAGDDSLDGFNY